MTEKYDIIIAGAGHNGLTVGAYLAKAGMNVCVVEKHEYVGGGVVTRELTAPGFKHDICSTWHGFIQANPMIKDDELGLMSQFGLKYLYPDIHTAVVFGDDSNMMFYHDLDKTCESIAQFSQKDAEAYRKFHDWSINILEMFTTGMFNPPPSFGAFMSMIDQSEEGRELLRAQLVSALDICNDWFESDELKIALTRFASEGMISPQTKGTGLILFVFIPLMHKYGGGLPVGGSGVLSDALAKCIEHHGGTIKVSSGIKKFNVSGDEITGVTLDSGEVIEAAKAVVTNMHIQQVFPGMVEGAGLPEGFLHKVNRLTFSDFVAMNQAYALHEAPKYKAGGDVDDAFWVEFCSRNLEEFLRGFENFSYGIPATDFPIAITPTLFDKTRAPEGKHTLYLYHFEPFGLKDGGAARWDEIGDEIADGLLDKLRMHTTNMGDENIIGDRWVHNPLDYSRYNDANVRGDFMHIGSHVWQNAGNRPFAGWSQYRMPVKKLYMCGPSTHPGAGATGGGRAAVQVVMEDLGIDFEKVTA